MRLNFEDEDNSPVDFLEDENDADAETLALLENGRAVSIFEIDQFGKRGDELGAIDYEKDSRVILELDNGIFGLFKFNKNYLNEVSAYIFSKELGFDVVLPTIIKTVNGAEGSLQSFDDDSSLGSELGDKESEIEEDIDKIKIFNFIIGNTDFYLENYLMTAAGEIKSIDNELSFSSLNLERALISSVRNIDEAGRYLNEIVDIFDKKLSDEIVDLMKRISENFDSIAIQIRKEALDLVLGHGEIDKALRRAKILAEIIVKNDGVIPSKYSKSLLEIV